MLTITSKFAEDGTEALNATARSRDEADAIGRLWVRAQRDAYTSTTGYTGDRVYSYTISGDACWEDEDPVDCPHLAAVNAREMEARDAHYTAVRAARRMASREEARAALIAADEALIAALAPIHAERAEIQGA